MQELIFFVRVCFLREKFAVSGNPTPRDHAATDKRKYAAVGRKRHSPIGKTMPDKQDQRKKDGERKDKETHAMHEHEAEIHREPHTHNPAGDVELVTANHANHEHGLQNKEINKANQKEVDIHSDDKNQRHTHVPKSEQLTHDLQAEEAKKK